MNDGEIFSSEIFFNDSEGYMQLQNGQVEVGSSVIFEQNVSRVYSKNKSSTRMIIFVVSWLALKDKIRLTSWPVPGLPTWGCTNSTKGS